MKCPSSVPDFSLWEKYKTKKKVLIANPMTGEITEVKKEDVEKYEKNIKGKQAKFLMSKKIGVIVSTKPGQEKLQFSKQAKINFYQSLLKTKLSELNYVVEKKFLSEVQSASERFAYQAGILTEELIRQNKSADKENVIKEFERFSPFLDTLRDKYEANSSYWMLIQHDINTLGILSAQLK